MGCRAVGIEAEKAKCNFVVNDLGFDACVDRRSDQLAAELKAACPKGVDVYFEEESSFWTLRPKLKPFSRERATVDEHTGCRDLG
jgi:hypothetical protein